MVVWWCLWNTYVALAGTLRQTLSLAELQQVVHAVFTQSVALEGGPEGDAEVTVVVMVVSLEHVALVRTLRQTRH